MRTNLDFPSDEELAKTAKDGNKDAFDTLCNRYLPCIFNRLRSLLPPEVVEDVTQEVFVAALQGIARFRGQSRFRTWITAIARHKVADYCRRRSRRPEVVPLDVETVNPAAPDAWEERALVRVALGRLPEHYQEVLLLRFAEGLPFKQIASLLDLSLEATKSRYRRAVSAMAQELEENRDERIPR
jgi:RNA polymerase sigma-70 factor (ECF subfamily)